MIWVAAFLILLVAAFSVAIVLNNNDPVVVNPNGTIDLSIYGAHVAVNEVGLYCTGAVVMLILLTALLLLRIGIRRIRTNHRQRKTLMAAATGKGMTGVRRKDPSTHALPGRAGEAKPAITEPSAERTAKTTAETTGETRAATLPEPPPGKSTPNERRALLDEVENATRERS